MALAAAGILLLSDFGGADLDGLGVALALLAGGFWAAYILLAVRVGQAFPGGGGADAWRCSWPWCRWRRSGSRTAARTCWPRPCWRSAFAVGMLSSAIPYTLELEALRRMPAGVFGVLMSLEPAVAAPAGFLVLDEDLATREVVAILLVVAASAGAARGAKLPPRDA